MVTCAYLGYLQTCGAVTITNIKGEAVQENRCPVCKVGVIVERTGKYGDFKSCSNFPRCKFKPRPNTSSQS
ncbi:topoisomerase DNA-binding C4 zinc finger domain-containing protein [Pseudomonas sp. P8_241]|uniref:topoisomerase DNA-binding C4 zinc finger domain-containing protein n=1 Tax=Pseudomonas sp. P8_241 TaxID=3043445 RepID=UPI0039B89335